MFGVFVSASGKAYNEENDSRITANWADFLERVEGWMLGKPGRVYAVVDNLAMH
ncbi:MAG: hypothetical protein WKH64_18630 [Chloroflexia bacterium]